MNRTPRFAQLLLVAFACLFLVLSGVHAAQSPGAKALVVCPPSDAAGCDRIAEQLALTTNGAGLAFPAGVDKRYQELRTMPLSDLQYYAVVFVPSLANAPYELLREDAVKVRLQQVLRGRVGVWSGTPDRGTTSGTSAGKLALLQNLARWGAAQHATDGTAGLVVLQDFSDDRPDGTSPRYDWVQGIAGVIVEPDLAAKTYKQVEKNPANPAAEPIVGSLAYDNMASFGLQLPQRSSAIGAWGQTVKGKNTTRGQIVLGTASRSPSACQVIGTGGGTFAFESGKVVLFFPAGALAESWCVSVSPANATESGYVASTAYSFGPSGLAFAHTPSAAVTIGYQESDIPGGASESDLAVHEYTSGAWLEVAGSTVDEAANTVTAPVAHFSRYAVFVRGGGGGGGGGGKPVESVTVTTDPAAPAGLNVPANTTRNLVATVLDKQGNPLSGRSVTWTYAPASSDPDVGFTAPTAGGTTTGTTDHTGNAYAVFRVGKTAGETHEVAATADTRSGAATLTVVAGEAAQLAFVQQPTSTEAGASITPAVTVAIRDAYGNTVTSSIDSVAVAIGINPSGGTVSGTLDVAAVGGIATFSDLSIDKAGAGYTLGAGALGLTGATSTPFDVMPAEPAAVVVDPATAEVATGGSQAFTASVSDAFGNTIASPTVNWSSSDPTVATVDPTTGTGTTATAATVLAANATVSIIATSGSAVGSASLTVQAVSPPDALDDSFIVTVGGTLSGNLTTDNGSGADDLGQPQATLVSISGTDIGGTVNLPPDPATASLAGGTLTVGADGTISLTPSTAGVYTFQYTLQNTQGSDAATVSILVDGPPTVTSTAPVGGAVVSTLAAITFDFSETVDATTSAFSLVCAATPVSFAASPALPGSGTTFILTPSSPLPEGSTCTATAHASGIADADGTPDALAADYPVSFTVDSAPSVTSTNPADGAELATANDDLGIDFSEPVTLGASWFQLVCGTTTLGPTDAAVSGTQSVTVNPNASLPAGSSCTMTIYADQISDQDGFDPPDNLTANYEFSFTVPITAVDDGYSATGNVAIDVAAAGVLGNDLPSTGLMVAEVQGNAGSVGNWTGTTATGLDGVSGRVRLNSDGSFRYDPPPGYTGTDQFTYTATNGSSTSNAATVTITVETGSVAGGGTALLWFVCGECATSNNRGTLLDPFTSVSAFTAANSGAAPAPQPSHLVHIQQGTYGLATDNLTLRDGQRAFGHAVAPSAVFTPDANSVSEFGNLAASVTRTVLAPSSGNAVTVASNNTLQGFDVTTNASGDGITTGAGSGTLAVGDVAIGGSGRALNLTARTLSGSFTGISSTGGVNNISLSNIAGASAVDLGSGSLSGSTGVAFSVSGGNAPLTYSGSITNAADRAVSITGRTGGSITLSGSITETGTGILVQSNSGGGTITFSGSLKTITTGTGKGVTLSSNGGTTVDFTGGGLAITTTGGNGFEASGGGTVQVTGAANSIASTGGIALSVASTTIGASGLTFQSISANGGANGIVLSGTGTSGGLTVTGDGVTPGSGGSILNTVGADGAVAGNGVYLSNTRNVSLNWVGVSGTQNNGLYGRGVRGLALNKMRFTGTNGTNVSLDESPVLLEDIGGAVKFTNSRFDGGAQNGVRIQNTLGTAPVLDSLVLENDTVSHIQGSVTDVRGTAMLVNLMDGTADVRVRNNHLTYWWGNAIHVLVQGTASATSRITGNTAHQTSGALAGSGGIWVAGGDHTYLISGNSVRFTNGTAISADRVQFGSHMQGTIENNQIGQSGVDNSGSAVGSGIFASHHGPGVTTHRVQNNSIRQVSGQTAGFIRFIVGDAAGFGGSGTINATVTGNDIQETGGGAAVTAHMGIMFSHGVTTGDADVGCYQVSGNTISNATTQTDRIRMNERFLGVARWPGYTGANNDNVAVAAFIKANNPAVDAVLVSNNVTAGGGGHTDTIPAGSACAQPAL